jgi:predicted metal-dependent phosphoesterase TrpH
LSLFFPAEVPMLNIDLHCHSNVSDGTLLPAELAARAAANGVDVWALTDHDEVGGIAEARKAAQDLGVHFVAGVEISITFAGKTVHIVGLDIDERHPDLQGGLASVREGRVRRGQQIATQLELTGLSNVFEGALKYAENPSLIGRTHFARYLVELGVQPTVSDVFRHYLVEGKPGFVPHRWTTLQEAVSWIRAAGGRAVIAHPGRYPFDLMQFDALLAEFSALGGEGIEVVTGSHTVDQFGEYAALARRTGLLASRGSDFHGPEESRVDLGSLPHLPADLKPVWHDWQL